MRRLRSVSLAFACVLPLSVSAQAPETMVQPANVVTLDIEDLAAEIQQILDDYRIPGASIALVDRSRTIWAGGVGKADLAAGIDVTADHLFRIGSVSKSFTALAALRAVADEGTVGSDVADRLLERMEREQGMEKHR